MEIKEIIKLDVLIIGSGCAGLNAADCLYDMGITDIAIATEGLKMGTSRNTGSDKQTYYKLNISGDTPDSVANMAEDLFLGGSVNGDTAYAEAAGSVRSFMKLASMGVPFPTNSFGEFVGYKTDHSEALRGTSAGPLTSKYMTEALEKSVKSKGIRIFDNTMVFKIIVNGKRAVGALAVKAGEIIAFHCKSIIAATGGPAAVYKASVYPASQTGMTALCINAGCETTNLCEWQYGLASTKFRWNVSGTYQQVIPRYISIDESGAEHEFLYDHMSRADAVNRTFLKGYQWPFDSKKIPGSSDIDLAVYNETVIHNRRVFLDFRREPDALKKNFNALSAEAKDYLSKSGALLSTPIARLEHMNSAAISLYKKHGIDLYSEPLEIALCAQHCNGGISVDDNWQTTVKNLYAAGELAGTFGVYRPGGSALNSTQVGSFRAAMHIKRNLPRSFTKVDFNEHLPAVCISKARNPRLSEITEKIQTAMTECAASKRNLSKMKDLLSFLENLSVDNMEISSPQLTKYFKLCDLIVSAREILKAMIFSAENIGTRGGSIVKGKENANNYFNNKIVASDGNRVYFKDVRPLPRPDNWFENVWKEFLNV